MYWQRSGKLLLKWKVRELCHFFWGLIVVFGSDKVLKYLSLTIGNIACWMYNEENYCYLQKGGWSTFLVLQGISPNIVLYLGNSFLTRRSSFFIWKFEFYFSSPCCLRNWFPSWFSDVILTHFVFNFLQTFINWQFKFFRCFSSLSVR